MIYNAVYFSEYLPSYTGNDTTLPFLFRHIVHLPLLEIIQQDQFLNDALTSFLYGSS